jgi:hypothetical protein
MMVPPDLSRLPPLLRAGLLRRPRLLAVAELLGHLPEAVALQYKLEYI